LEPPRGEHTRAIGKGHDIFRMLADHGNNCAWEGEAE
jgi:hypothetical protein